MRGRQNSRIRSENKISHCNGHIFLFEIVSLIDVRHVLRFGVNFVKFSLEELLNEINYIVSTTQLA